MSSLESSAIRILLKAARILSFVKTFARDIRDKTSSSSGSGYRSFRVIALSFLKSIQRRRPLEGFYTNRISNANGAELASIYPFLRLSVSYSLSTSSSSSVIFYKGE